ncbi:MAG: NAD(P)/FAD-dependent oxidoreductase, partial [Anaerovorax sp.]
KRFLEVLCSRLDLDLTLKASQLSGTNLKEMVHLLTADRFSISGLGGYGTAMVTSGGVSLKEVNLKTLESKLCPHLYFAGEVLDVDGDTGGYNLQFAFSCAYLVAQSL